MKANPYALTDEEIPSYSKFNTVFNLGNYLRKKYNSSEYQKFFLNSILSVKKPNSQIALLDFLNYFLDASFHHFTTFEIEQTYKILFKDLPNKKDFQENFEVKNCLFKCMNVFMIKFYNSMYPFFYDLDNEESLFSYDTNFVINYLNNMNPTRLQKDNINDQLFNDGSYTNILNYLFELLFDGIEYDTISEIINNIFGSIDFKFFSNFISKKFFSKSSAIFVNHQKKYVFLMNYMISFYEKKICEIIKLQNHQMQHEQNEKKLNRQYFQDIIQSQLFEFLESFLFNYTKRLIYEGRLINTQNPFKSDQEEFQTESYKFYPEKVDDKVILKCLNIISDLILIFPKDEVIKDYFSNFSSIYRIIPMILTIGNENSTYLLFEYLQESDLKKFDILKNIFYETIRDRIIGNYKEDYNSIKEYFTNEEYDLKSESIITFISQLLIVVSPTEFFEKLHFDNIEHHLQLFSIIYKYLKRKEFFNLLNVQQYLLLYYKDYSTRPEIITEYMKALMELPKENAEHLKESIKNIINFILKEPEIADKVDSNLIINFFRMNKNIKYDFSYLESLFNIYIENFDTLKIQLIFILLGDPNSETFIKYRNKTFQKICDELLKLEDLNEKNIQFVIEFAAHFSAVKTNDQRIIGKIKKCISYIKEQEKINFYDYQKNDFGNSAEQVIFYLICFLIKSFGFIINEEYLSFISDLLKKYGMCIEVLNAISKIIGLLIPFISNQSISNEGLLNTNKIFEIAQILIDNSIKLDSQNEYHNDYFGFQRYSQQYIQFHFSLFENELRSENGNKNNTYMYSYKMNGKSIDDKFGYLINLNSNSSNECSSRTSKKIVKSFITNISEYATAMINNFGDQISHIEIFQKIISFSKKVK